MATMNISLPDGLREYVEERVVAGGYSTASEYFRELVRADQTREARERLDRLLLEGLEGESKPLTAEVWAEIRREYHERVAKRKKKVL